MTDYNTFFNLLAEVTTYAKYYEKPNAGSCDKNCFQIPCDNEHFKYLHDGNKLLPLYEFVQNEKELFVKYQKEARIIWGLFAFIDTNGVYKDSLRYLFSPFDKKIHKHSLHPHFLIKVFSRNDKDELVAETPEYVMNLTKIAYFVRQHEAGNHEFINFFKSGLSGASDFEKSNEVLYVSSEEVDYCILKELSTWCNDEGNISIEKFKEYYKKNIGENIINEYGVALDFFDSATNICWESICKNLGLDDTKSPRYTHLKAYIQQINSCDKECDFSYTNFKNKYKVIPLRFNLPIHIYTRVSNRTSIQKNRRSIVVFPIAKQPGDDNNLVGFAMLVIEDDDPFVEADMKIRITQLKAIMGLLGEAEYREVYLHGLEEANKAEFLNQATRAAISQVMARNMSHNIGSHVLSKFKNIEDIRNTSNGKQYSGNLPNLNPDEQIAYFNDYLKTRMDFLADITLTTPILETPYKFCSDILLGFLKNHILLNRISGITGNPKYKIQTRIFNGENWFDDNLTNDFRTWDNDGFTVSMPNDVLGCHAFYIILENIIRNTYKHSKATLPEFVFTIELKEIENPDLIEIRIYDNNCKPIDEINKTVANRNSSFNEELIKENKLREGSLGTIEMEVCAAFLRKISLGEYEKSIYKVNEKGFNEIKGKIVYNLIRAYANLCNDNSDNASLGYVFYLRKPKELLIVSDTIQQKEEWEKVGIDVIKKSDLQKESFGHQIILSNEEIPKHITHTPRIIQFADTEIKDLSSSDLIDFAWNKYGEAITADLSFQFKRKEQNNYFKEENGNNLKVEFFDHASGYNNATDKANGYIEASHHHTAKIRIDNTNSPSIKNLVELVELAKISVCLIDERIQTFYLEKSYHGSDGVSIAFKDYFPHIGIHIPTKEEADLNSPNFGEIETENSVQFNLKEYLNKQNETDFIILHLGITEKLIEDKSKETVEQKIKELLNQNEELYKKIILTSGRGTPSTIPDNCRYLPLSAVQHCVETTFDKFLLVKALYNSRKTNSN